MPASRMETTTSALKQRQQLPDASRRNVLSALQVVRTAARHQKFSQRWLKEEHGIGQNRQAMRLLRFLSLVDHHDRLPDDVLDSRANLAAFQVLLVERLRQGCHQAGFSGDEIELLTDPDSTWPIVREVLEASRPVAELTPGVRNNVMGCFKSLDEVLHHLRSDRWLDEEVGSFAKASPHPAAAVASPTAAPVPPAAADPSREVTVPYGRKQDGTLIYARVVFDGPASADDLFAVGRQVQQLASLVLSDDLPAENARG